MKRFNFKAKDIKGEMVAGEVEASTSSLAAKLIREKGFVVITVTPKKEMPLNFLRRFQERITVNDVVNFTRQLATMINSGLPLTESLVILRTQSKGTMQKIASQVLADIEGGGGIINCFIKTPQSIWPNLYCPY